MRIELAIEDDELIVRLWQDGPEAFGGSFDRSVLIDEARMKLNKLYVALINNKSS